MKKAKFFWDSNLNASNTNWVTDVSFYSNTYTNLNGYFMYDNGSWDIYTNNNKDLSELPKPKIKAKPKKK